MCGSTGGRYQCYAGHAGWGAGQLEREITEGTWIVSPADPMLVLDSPATEIWLQALKAVGIDPSALVPGSDAQA